MLNLEGLKIRKVDATVLEEVVRENSKKRKLQDINNLKKEIKRRSLLTTIKNMTKCIELGLVEKIDNKYLVMFANTIMEAKKELENL